MTFGHDVQKHRTAHERNIQKKGVNFYVLIRLFKKSYP